MKEIKSFNDYIGNDNTKALLKESINASKLRNEPLDHVFIAGCSGCGKSELAMLIGKEMNVHVEKLMCSTIKNSPQILNTKILKMKDNDILFLDELHSLDSTTSESLYEYLESGLVSIRYPDRMVRIPGKKITIIAATTELAMIPTPLYNRFPIQIRLSSYTIDELHQIISMNMDAENISYSHDAISTIAKASRSVPRNALQFIRRIRDHIISNQITFVDSQVVLTALALTGIDENGLDKTDRAMLHAMFYIFNASPVGLSNIANQIGEDEQVIKTMHEPILMSNGYIEKTSRGRILTAEGIKIAMELDY
jgi:Holliday junction DNA helicase RuvB